ncbi:MAG: thiamine phosphate synthase [Pseudomonadota bacterium]
MGDKDQSARQRKVRAAARRSETVLPPYLPPVWFLTDDRRTPDAVGVAEQLPRGWGVIFRHRPGDDGIAAAGALAQVCRRGGLAFLVAHNPKLAMAVGADGVHWPEVMASASRRWAGRFSIMTASAHSRAALSKLAQLPLDAALRSVVFQSRSASAGTAMGPLKFRSERQRARLPVYALGGVSDETAGRVAGVAGLAAIEGIAATFSG